MSDHNELRRKRTIDHAFHVWINKRQQERPKGEPWEHDLYEWKHALQETERLPHWLKQARDGTLPTVHQQCSHSAPETIEQNRLICALGVDVLECPILANLYTTFADEVERERIFAAKVNREPYLEPDDTHIAAAKVCAWHIFMTTVRKPHSIDTSEGYVKDESDRRFWGNVYESLSRADSGE